MPCRAVIEASTPKCPGVAPSVNTLIRPPVIPCGKPMRWHDETWVCAEHGPRDRP